MSDRTYWDLSRAERDILLAIGAGDTPNGQEIKSQISGLRDETAAPATPTLYGSIDSLGRKGLIDTVELNGRSNGHRLTDAGESALQTLRNTINT